MTEQHETLLTTPLHALHIEVGAKMVPFAGYDMPVQYALGVKKSIYTPVKQPVCLMFPTWGNCVCTVLKRLPP